MDTDFLSSIYFALSNEMICRNKPMHMPIFQTEPNERQTRWSLILGILIWFTYQNLLNALTSLSCKWSWLFYRIAGMQSLQFVEIILSLIALLSILYMIFLAWRFWRSFQTKKPTNNPKMLEETEEDSRPLMAFVAMLLNGFFFVFIIATFVPMLALKPCGLP